MSGVHYGHYKAVIQDEMSSEILALQLTVIVQSSIPPENWSLGLQVMLEKIAGVCPDFTCYDQFIFGKHAMQTLTESGYIPEELFSQKGTLKREASLNMEHHLREKHREDLMT